MTIPKAAICVTCSVIICGLLGVAIGMFLGVVAPGYYRSVFANGTDPSFNPLAVGAGLGLTQGLIAGVVIGCVITLAVAWYQSRTTASS